MHAYYYLFNKNMRALIFRNFKKIKKRYCYRRTYA